MAINLSLNVQKAQKAVRKVTVDAQHLNEVIEQHFRGWMLRLRDARGRLISNVERDKILLEQLAEKQKEIKKEVQITIAEAGIIEQIIQKERREIETTKQFAKAQLKEMEVETARVLSTMRRVATFSSYVFQFLGETTGQILSMLAETITLTVQTAQFILQLDVATAFASPWRAAFTLATVGIRLALIGMLMLMSVQISVYKQQVSSRINAAVGAMRIITV